VAGGLQTRFAEETHHARYLDSLVCPSLPILEKIIRPIIIYFFLVLVFRLSGKCELVSFIGKTPDVEEKRQRELLHKIDQLSEEITLLRNTRPPSVA
jgi:hypothetical protein